MIPIPTQNKNIKPFLPCHSNTNVQNQFLIPLRLMKNEMPKKEIISNDKSL